MWVKTTCPVQDKQMKSRVILSAHLPRQRRVQRFKVGSVDGFNSSAPTSLLSLTIFCIVIGEMPTISPMYGPNLQHWIFVVGKRRRCIELAVHKLYMDSLMDSLYF